MERGEVLRSVVVLLMPRASTWSTSGIFSLDGEDFEVDNNVWLVGDDAEVAGDRRRPRPRADPRRRRRPAGGGDRGHPRPQRPHQRRRRAGRGHRRADPAPPGRRGAVGAGPPRAVGRATWPTASASTPAATTLVVLHTPGHTPGGVLPLRRRRPAWCSAPTRCSTGGPGATGRSFSSFPDIIESIRTKLLVAARPTRSSTPATATTTTIGAETPGIDEWI